MDIFWKKPKYHNTYIYQLEFKVAFISIMSRPKLKTPDYIEEVLIDNINKWARVCPKCNNKILHKSLYIAKQCHNKKRLCQKCGCAWGKGMTKETHPSLLKMSKNVSKSMKKFRKTNPPWNKGLTKETSDIVKHMSENHVGFKHDDKTKKVIGEYSKELWKNDDYRSKIINKLKEIIGDENHINEWRLKMEQNGYFTPLELKSEFEKYKQLVWTYTRKNNLSLLENYDKRGRSKYHVDHKFSITQGFLNNIPPEIIGSFHNLEMLYHTNNIRKNSKCSITKEELLKLYYGEN